jgi:hypothetical protein
MIDSLMFLVPERMSVGVVVWLMLVRWARARLRMVGWDLFLWLG